MVGAVLGTEGLLSGGQDRLEIVLKVGLEAALVHSAIEVDRQVRDVEDGLVDIHEGVRDGLVLLHNHATSDSKVTIEPSVPLLKINNESSS